MFCTYISLYIADFVTHVIARAYKIRKWTDKKFVMEVMTTVKYTSLWTSISQLETSTMIVNKLDACLYDSVKLVKETLSQINRSESREDIAGGKKVDRGDMKWLQKSRKKVQK